MVRRTFITTTSLGSLAWLLPFPMADYIMTVNGPVPVRKMGVVLPHEHVTTDFTGAELVVQPQYDSASAVKGILPYFEKLKALGCQTFFECTPNYIGRDVLLLQQLSRLSGLQIVTNTGYYAAANYKYLPKHFYEESAAQLAQRWIKEWEEGIDGTGIRPGFIKIGVNKAPLTPDEHKLVKAAAIAHLQTGLSIAIHTGDGAAAAEEQAWLAAEGVAPSAMIWVHAQKDAEDGNYLIEMAKRGVWLSLDGVNARPRQLKQYLYLLQSLKQEGLLHRVLISHDDGWAVNAKVENGKTQVQLDLFNNGNTKPYHTIFEQLIPHLYEWGFSKKEVNQIMVKNPQEAFAVRVRRG